MSFDLICWCTVESVRNEADSQYFNQIPTLWFYNAINFLSHFVARFFTVSNRVTNLVTLIKEMKEGVCFLVTAEAI